MGLADDLRDDGYYVSPDMYDRIDTLESKLAESERTIGQLKHRIGEIEDERGATIAEKDERIAELDGHLLWALAARDEARRVVAFFASVIKGGEQWSAECDRALREAMGEAE